MTRITRHCLLFIFLCCLGVNTRAQDIFTLDTLWVQHSDCQGLLDVCIPLPNGNINQYTFLQDGMPYPGGVSGCDFDTIVTYTYNTLPGLGNMGPYQLNSWMINGQQFQGVFQDIDALVLLLNQWDPAGDWQHKPANLTITGGAAGKIYSNMLVTVLLNNTPSIIGVNFGLLPMGTEMTFGEGSHSVIAINNFSNARDTLYVEVQCAQGSSIQTVSDTIQANGYPYATCMDLSPFSGSITQFFNACPDASGDFVHFYLDSVNYCVKYQGLVCGGTETACIVLCDDEGVCDTTFLQVTTDFSLCSRISQKLTDTLLVNFTKTICIDTLQLSGPIVSVINLCPDDSGENVAFEYDEETHCVSYTGLAPGGDRGCFLLVDGFGNSDTVFICIEVGLPQSGIILDTLLIGQSETYCVDPSELAGNVISIENICLAIPVHEVSFSVNAVNLCVNAQGMSLGTDTACIVICDSYGVCDTTQLFITVVPDVVSPCPNSLPPVAEDDLASTLLNTPDNIDIMANDSPGDCPPVSLRILEPYGMAGPYFGTAVLNPNTTIDYVPNRDFCGVDRFRYELCTPMGCDTATVTVEVACHPPDTIIVYNGISPNGDGANDYFTIENIEHFPDNEVKVFNRWGNLVFQIRGYDNTWDGRYGNKMLPDGSYFYRILLGDGRQFTGFIQIQR